MSQSLADQFAATALSGGNAAFIEELYDEFLRDPGSLDPAWREYFKGLAGGGEIPHGPIRERLISRLRAPQRSAGQGNASDGASAKQGAVSRLIQVYMNRGHLIAKLDPLGMQERAKPYVLDLEYFGLSPADLDTEFFTGSRNSAIAARAKLKDILAQLKFIYCDTIGAEFAHVSDTEERLWLQDHFQSQRLQHRFHQQRLRLSWPCRSAKQPVLCRRRVKLTLLRKRLVIQNNG